MTPIADRQVSRFRRFLNDVFPDEQTIARYREAQSVDELCECGNYPVVHSGRCFTCLSRGAA